VQLHFALFDGHSGFVLKPVEMRVGPSRPAALGRTTSVESTNDKQQPDDDWRGWPPPRRFLQCVTLQVNSLHNLPKRRERRPCYRGPLGACHTYHPELSGETAPPNGRSLSCPVLSFSIHPIGGVCALASSLPFDEFTETELILSPKYNGMNAEIGEAIHCIAAEPHATFLRVAVFDGRYGEVAFETAVLGRLRGGHRVIRLRDVLGTRIELCYLFVKISFGMEPNMWLTLRQLGIQSSYRGSSSAPSSPAAQGVVDSIERIVVNVFQAQETLVAAVSNTVELDDVHARQSAVEQSREETQADIPGRLTT